MNLGEQVYLGIWMFCLVRETERLLFDATKKHSVGANKTKTIGGKKVWCLHWTALEPVTLKHFLYLPLMSPGSSDHTEDNSDVFCGSTQLNYQAKPSVYPCDLVLGCSQTSCCTHYNCVDSCWPQKLHHKGTITNLWHWSTSIGDQKELQQLWLNLSPFLWAAQVSGSGNEAY